MTMKGGHAELLACLTLLAPHLGDAERDAWVRIAAKTLTGMPADLFLAGCAVARLKARFPGDVVPIIAETAETGYNGWGARKRRLTEVRAQEAARLAPPVEQVDKKYVTPEEMREILAEVGHRVAP
jgi:hypothetical protein